MEAFFQSFIPLYTYCEHSGLALSQPLNFLSCIVFWYGAVWMLHTQSPDDATPSFNQVTATLLFFLGLTGMAWHFTGEPLMLLVDMFVLFLLLIIVAVVVTDDILRWDLKRGLSTLIILICVSALMKDQAVRLPQNGGVFLPLLFFLAMAALKMQTVNEEVTVYLLSGSYTLFFGLLCRTADSYMCPWFPQGLHFLWHILLVITIVYIGKALTAMKAVPWPEEEPLKEEAAQEA